MNLKSILAKNYINFRGLSTNRKIVVIESDDWGSVRVADSKVWDNFSEKYPQVKSHKFLKYDGLERKEDLEYLFELLSKIKDSNNNPAVVTALALTSNPDFARIEETRSYHAESIKETYQSYGEEQLFDLWMNEGVKNNLLFPQFHGKEHLFPERYITRIKNKNDIEYEAFTNKSIFGINTTDRRENFLAAFEYHSDEDKFLIEKRAQEGLKEFKDLFGFDSKSFCPSQSIYGDHLFDVLKASGVIAIQAGRQFIPYQQQIKKLDHQWGDRTSNGLIFWRRNCTFEPYKKVNFDHVSDCLKEIEIAFRWGKPAVINTHRVNFTSRLRSDLRDRSLRDLQRVLKTVLQKWPDAVFINSSQLAEIMIATKK